MLQYARLLVNYNVLIAFMLVFMQNYERMLRRKPLSYRSSLVSYHEFLIHFSISSILLFETSYILVKHV